MFYQRNQWMDTTWTTAAPSHRQGRRGPRVCLLVLWAPTAHCDLKVVLSQAPSGMGTGHGGCILWGIPMWCTGVHPQGTSHPLWPVWGVPSTALRAHHSHRGRCRVMGAFLPVLVVALWFSPLMGMAGMLTLWPMWHSCWAPVLLGCVVAVFTGVGLIDR